MADDDLIIADFLESPDDYRYFLSFFELTYHMARGYLRRLQARGWKLPLQEYSSQSSVDDCTVDLLATLYRSDNGRPYYLILDHFDRPTGTSQSLCDRLKSLVAGHIHQELDRIKNTLNVTAFHIKRQVTFALKSGDYEEVSLGPLRCWRWTAGDKPRLDGHPLAERERVREWARAAVRDQKNMPQRVRTVFEALDRETALATALPLYALITAFRAVLDDPDDHQWGTQPLPSTVYFQAEIRRLVDRAISDSADEGLGMQNEKKGLGAEVQGAFLAALRALMHDFVEHGEHDKIPQYLYEQIPGLESKAYLKAHKYAWETLVADCKERLRELLRIHGMSP